MRHVKCTFLDCFYTHLQLERAISVLIFISLHISVCKCFLQIVGKVLWHGRWGPFPHGRHFIDMVQKSFFAVCILLYLSKHLFNIMNFVGIASHITCTFLSDYSINFHVYMLISVYILIFSHIFCLGMLGIDHKWRDMAWQINPLIFDWRLQWHFSQVDTTLRIWQHVKQTFMSDVWVLLHFWEYFTKFGCTISYSSYIYHCFIKMWYMLLK